MRKQRHRLAVEILESRHMLSGKPWFEIGEQHPGANSFGIVLGDLDGDNDLDALITCFNSAGRLRCDANAVWMNDGQGQFNKDWSDTTPVVTRVALGDLDSDGDLDALIGRGFPHSGNYSDKVWMNDGKGNLTDSGQSLGRGNTWDVDLGDVDNDGDLDAVLANVASSSSVWLNDGLGDFTDSSQKLGSSNTFSVALGDLDGDDDLDAFLGIRGSDKVYLNDGHGNFSDSGQRLGRRWANAVQLGDLDGDGDLDAFVANGDQTGTGQRNEVWLNDGLANFTNSGQNLGRSLSRWAELGDLDGDGDLDAFVGNGASSAGQPNMLWRNDGAGNFSDSEVRLGRSGTVGLSLGDIDGDGDVDVLFGQLFRENEVWFNVLPVAGDANRDGAVDFADFLLLSANFNKTAAVWADGDFDGDGIVAFADFLILSANFGFPKVRPDSLG